MGWFNDVADTISDKVESIGNSVVQGANDIADGSAFNKDGWMTNFVQDNIPLGGEVTAIFHAAAGNEDYAQVAAIKGLATTVEFGVMAGATALGGPVLGGAVSGFLNPLIGQGIEGAFHGVGETNNVAPGDGLPVFTDADAWSRAAIHGVVGGLTGAAIGGFGSKSLEETAVNTVFRDGEGELIGGAAISTDLLEGGTSRTVIRNEEGELLGQGAANTLEDGQVMRTVLRDDEGELLNQPITTIEEGATGDVGVDDGMLRRTVFRDDAGNVLDEPLNSIEGEAIGAATFSKEWFGDKATTAPYKGIDQGINYAGDKVDNALVDAAGVPREAGDAPDANYLRSSTPGLGSFTASVANSSHGAATAGDPEAQSPTDGSAPDSSDAGWSGVDAESLTTTAFSGIDGTSVGSGDGSDLGLDAGPPPDAVALGQFGDVDSAPQDLGFDQSPAPAEYEFTSDPVDSPVVDAPAMDAPETPPNEFAASVSSVDAVASSANDVWDGV
jgi:hypothetical protein